MLKNIQLSMENFPNVYNPTINVSISRKRMPDFQVNVNFAFSLKILKSGNSNN